MSIGENRWIKSILRGIVGVIFILSAILKLRSIDTFEMYFYSLGLFNLDLSVILVRLIISFEFILGTLLLSHLFSNAIYYISITSLMGFSIFLVIQIFNHTKGNCNCFGDLIKMSPIESLVKNAIMITMLVVIREQKGIKLRSQKFILAGVIFLSVTIPMIASPPDFMVARRYEGGADILGSSENIYFQNFVEKFNYDEGKKVICFFSMGCKFCKLASQKVSIMAGKYEKCEVVYVFFGRQKSLDRFWTDNPATRYPFHIMPIKEFFRISNGRIPLIVFLDNGNIKGIFGYRNLGQKDFERFMKD